MRGLVWVLLLASLTVFGQVEVKIPYNSRWEITKNKDAIYFRETFLDTVNTRFSGSFKDKDRSGNLLKSGTYKNGKKHGQFVFYHFGSNQVESQGQYDEGQRSGLWEFYNEAGAVMQRVDFAGDDFHVLEYTNFDGEMIVKDGTGNWQLFVGSGVKGVVLTARFFKGERSGKWIYKYSSGKRILSESYKNGELIEGVFYAGNEKSKYQETKLKADIFDPPELKVTEAFKTDHNFYGQDAINYILDVPNPFDQVPATQQANLNDGISELYGFISENIQYPISAINQKLEGQVVIEVLIDKNDKPVNFKVIKGVTQDLNAEAVRLLKLYDGWDAPEINGEKVMGRKVVPITFKVK